MDFIKNIIAHLRASYYSWKFARIKPKSNAGSPFGSFGVYAESKDDIDVFILQDIAVLPIDLNVEVLCFRGDKKIAGEYIEKIFAVTQALLKSNEHRRKYVENEKRLMKKFWKASKKDPNKHIDLTLNPVELNSEIDGFLSQLKAALDSLACTLNPLFDFGLSALRKDVKGTIIKKKSGYQIIEKFEKANEPVKQRSLNFRDYLEKNGAWLTYLAMLRDMPIHGGGLKNVTPLVFEQKTKKVIPQKIHHPNGQVENAGDFMKRTIKEVSEFCNYFVIFSLVIKTGIGLIPTKRDDGGHPRYYWTPPHMIPAEDKKEKP